MASNSHWPPITNPYIRQKKDFVGILALKVMTLQQYTFLTVHRPGEQHQNADGLSRLPQESSHA